jgi:hypothetical protein
MADNTKKTSDNNRKSVGISESNAALSGKIVLGSDSSKHGAIEVRNAAPPPPNPNRGKDSK